MREQPEKAPRADSNSVSELDIDRYRPSRYLELASQQCDFCNHYREQRFRDPHRHHKFSDLRHRARLADSDHDLHGSRHGPRRNQFATDRKGGSRPARSTADHDVHCQPDRSQRWSNGHTHLGDLECDLRCRYTIHLRQR